MADGRKQMTLLHLGAEKALRSIILEARNKTCQLVELNMSGLHLPDVDAELLANAVTKIKTISLENSRLSATQATAICNAILVERNLALEELSLSYSGRC